MRRKRTWLDWWAYSLVALLALVVVQLILYWVATW